MNYLGHLFLSFNNNELALANLFGDFVKGKQYLNYSEKIQKGILLHRKIDSYIDNHAAVKALTKKLYTQLPKVAPVAIDIYFDHLLAKNWNTFHSSDLSSFLSAFYSESKLYESEYPGNFIAFLNQMREKNWFIHYATEFGLQKMCDGVSSKFSFPNELIHGYTVYKSHEDNIIQVFNLFMDDAISTFIN